MKYNLKAIVGAVSGIGTSLLPIMATAATLPTAPITSLTGFENFLCTVVAAWMFTFLIILAVIFVLIAAFKYLTAAGDPEKVKSAGSTLIYAAVAIVVALFARGLPLIIGSLFGTTLGAAGC